MRILLIMALLASALPVAAKTSEWTDLQGTTFKGEPLEILGPYALFRTSFGGGKRVLLRGFSNESIQRFWQEARDPDPTPRWSDTHADATEDVVGHALQLGDNGKLVKVDFTQVEEPRLLLVLYGSHNDGEGWDMSNALSSIYKRFQRVHPGQLGCLFIGLRHDREQHLRIVTQTGMPWYVADLDDQPEMRTLIRYAPKEGSLMLLMSRNGQVILSGRASDKAAIAGFVDALYDFLWQLDAANPKFWPDRQHYRVGAPAPARARPVRTRAGREYPARRWPACARHHEGGCIAQCRCRWQSGRCGMAAGFGRACGDGCPACRRSETMPLRPGH